MIDERVCVYDITEFCNDIHVYRKVTCKRIGLGLQNQIIVHPSCLCIGTSL